MSNHFFLPAGLAVFAAVAWGQSFEVASVKVAPPEPPGQSTMGYGTLCPAIRYTNLAMLDLLVDAYQVKEYQISGPKWLDDREPRYVIGATCPASTKEPEIRRMLRALLAERFHLSVHFEKKELPVYALTVQTGGAKMGRSTELGAGGFSEGGGGPGALDGKFTMTDLATMLARYMDRPVVDRTGLEGMFDVKLRWVPDNSRAASGGSTQDPGSIFTAVKEQLGLRLSSGKAPIDLLVVDRVEKLPTEN